MAIVWNNRIDRFDLNGGNGRGSFEEHNERMREFRKSHADVAMVNGPRLDESALLESTRPLHVADLMRVTRRSRCHASTEDWSAFVSVWKVALYKLSQN